VSDDDPDGASTESAYDLVVLAVGLRPRGSADLPVDCGAPGTFVAGTAGAVMDIAATLADARGVAINVAAYLASRVGLD
jgi:heterodisulfide reductase subunit A-like polyferredoxin